MLVSGIEGEMLVSGIEHGTSFLNLLQPPLAHQWSWTTLDNIIA